MIAGVQQDELQVLPAAQRAGGGNQAAAMEKRVRKGWG
jgi:hypothetical protein